MIARIFLRYLSEVRLRSKKRSVFKIPVFYQVGLIKSGKEPKSFFLDWQIT